MDKTTTPPILTPSIPPAGLRATVPPRASAGPEGEGFVNYRSTYMAPAGARKFAPVIIVGALAAAAMIGYGFMFDKAHPDDATLARGPAVESLVENEPTAAGPADAASAVIDTAAPPVTPEPAPVAAPEPVPAPAVTPRAPAAPAAVNARPNRSVPLPRPNDTNSVPLPAPEQPIRPPEPQLSEPPLRTTPPLPTLDTPAPPVNEPPIQPPAVEPMPTPSPVPQPAPVQ